jgi:hypothetical protein
MERPDFPELPDDDRTRHQPDHARLPPDELDLTGSVDQAKHLNDVITDALIEAKSSGGEIPEWGARDIARLLANHQQSTTSNLHHFAVTGRSQFTDLHAELSALYNDPDVVDFARDCINWLGTYLLAAERREDRDALSSYSARIQEAIKEKGPALAAYLKLPDITEDNALDTFDEHYQACYATPAGLIEDMIDTLGLERELADSGVDHFASVDPDKVMHRIRDAWDIVRYDDKFYLFEK